MSTSEILNQEEIDALLHGVENGQVETESGRYPDDSRVRSCDLTVQDRIVRGKLPTLEMLNERFVRFLQASLFNMLKRSADINAAGINMLKYADYTNGLALQTCLNLVRVKPLRGNGLVVIDPKLLFVIVDGFFGGDGRFQSAVEQREVTPTEMRVVRLLLDMLFRDLKEAWAPVLPVDFEYIKSETNPQLASIASPAEMVVDMRFHIEFDGNGGELSLTLPYSMLEPVRGLLSSGIKSDLMDVDERWTDAMKEEMKGVRVGMSCTLAEIELDLRELISLGVGDIIPIDLPRSVVVDIEGVPGYRCEYGTYQGHNALKILEPIRRARTSEKFQLLAKSR
jgi:flagellar motor switch protein FliM